MSFKISCPHCTRTLSVTEPAFGKIVPCPGCAQPIKVPNLAPPSRPVSPVGAVSPWSNVAQNGAGALNSARPLPVGMPPMPEGDPAAQSPSDPLSFLHSGANPKLIDGNATSRYEPSDSLAVTRKPVGLVWIVFYWSLGGVAAIVVGLALSMGASFIGSMSQGLEDAFRSRRPDSSVIATELMGLGGLLLFHYGLLLELACYGLWTFRRWALPLAKILAVLQAVAGLIGLVAALVMRTAIVANLFGLVVSVGIVVYLYGSSNLSERLQKVFSRVRQVDGQTWEGYQ